MSTRANIKIMDNLGEILLYKHCDGYPRNQLAPQIHGIIPVLHNYMFDCDKSARSLANKLIKEAEFEATTGMHGDIEYYYEVDMRVMEVVIFKRNRDTDENEMKEIFYMRKECAIYGR